MESRKVRKKSSSFLLAKEWEPCLWDIKGSDASICLAPISYCSLIRLLVYSYVVFSLVYQT